MTEPSAERAPVYRLWLVVTLICAVAPHVLHLPAWISASVLGVVIVQVLRRHRQAWALPRRLAVPLSLAAAVGLLLQYRSLFGREVGVAMLVLMLTLKLIEIRKSRDALLVIYLSYFIVVTHSLYSQSVQMALYQFAALFIITAGLLVHTARDCRQPLRQAASLLAQAVPLMLILFVLFPRIAGPLWRLPGDAHAARTGISDRMSPGSFSSLAQSDAIAMRIDFTGEAPANTQRYWRGPVFWHFDGRTWTAGADKFRIIPRGRIDGGQSLSYRVTLEPSGQRWLFALDVPEQVSLPALRLPGTVLLSARDINQRLVYDAQSRVGGQLQDLSPPDRAAALQLPPISPRVAALAARWRNESASDAELTERAMSHLLGGGFVYTLEPPLLGEDPVDAFLFESRRGFCEHYASAFTVLMRAAGIPARVVTGYLGAEYNNLGGYWIVRQADAHAWSEVWLEGEGWRRVDPTSIVAPTRIEDIFNPRLAGAASLFGLSDDNPVLAAAHRLRLGLDALEHAWDRWVIGYDQASQRALLDRLGVDGRHWRNFAMLLLIGCGGFIVVLAGWLLWRTPRSRDPVLAAYQRWCRYLGRHGITHAAHEPPSAFAQRVSAAYPAQARDIDTITRLYLLLRYGTPNQRDARLADLRHEVGRFRCG